MTTKPVSRRIGRLHSKNPIDAAWRAQQAQVDADIEGMHRDPALEQFHAEMKAAGLEPRERIKRLKAYIRHRVK